jgi:L-threonylcarbamoyladenylate synthase
MSGEDEINQAVEILRRGGLVALPTETVYGVGADATNSAAIARIFAAKSRPSTNPLIVHVADIATARRYVTSWPPAAEALARKFWPGPLTLVLPKSGEIVPEVTVGLPTVAIRCPDHPVALELLRRFDGPVAAPSANRSSRISPTTADHVRRELGDKIDMVLDGGPCRVGIESTVVDLASAAPAILRPGAITRQQIEQFAGPIELRSLKISQEKPSPSPGQHPVHYSPSTPAFRISAADAVRFPKLFETSLGRKQILVIIRDTQLAAQLKKWINPEFTIEMPPSAEQYAQRLYSALHDADQRGAGTIWIQEPPDEPAWLAVRDRIFRATRPPPE